MAATLAGLIRGRDVVQDAQALMQVAAHQLDVHMLSFNEVLGVLQDAGYVQGVQRSGNKIVSFTETIPYYGDLYSTLGEAWQSRAPTELEQQLIVVVNGLARAPEPVESLESTYSLDAQALPQLLGVAKTAGLIKTFETLDGSIAYSPFYGFENPQLLGDLVNQHGSDRLIEELSDVRARQGLELRPGEYPLLTQAVAGGLIMAPSVQLPDGTLRAFAALPYIADPTLLRARKQVLEKALAVLACLRCAENHADFNTLTPEALIHVINKLLDPNRGFLNPNSSHKRQYALMRNAGLIFFGPDTRVGGSWVTPRFIDTEDNRDALLLARDLLKHGEVMERRVDDSLARSALDAGQAYEAPMQTTHRMRDVAALSPQEFERVFEKVMGRGAL